MQMTKMGKCATCPPLEIEDYVTFIELLSLTEYPHISAAVRYNSCRTCGRA